MPAWGNKDVVLYHGTDDLAVGAQLHGPGSPLPLAVNLALCRSFTDFGQGFYCTTSIHQAQQWANARLLRMLAPTGPAPCAIVLEFKLSRDWLASLDMLAFVRPINDFWDLVDDCRNGFAPHQRSVPHNVCYDVVCGPVTIWPQRLVIQDCDQFSFHTQRAVRGLKTPVVHSKGSPANGGKF
ncbi:DUF3990 domain-containing protein [Bradyrhizobium tropiciagri]|uniref:DUF3990 domain-containing protein n=1 Tax=Bradyrhizobium tropiciagri TaxID=312253 RepID=UPI001BA671CA|nr:DUF3990 domain-containing protein [Bradyrhizobium tropiciagri]MBR0871283.1 DUF3990 domain-containing protein [Bradyrhizobium tropiciagri]